MEVNTVCKNNKIKLKTAETNGNKPQNKLKTEVNEYKLKTAETNKNKLQNNQKMDVNM